MSVSLEIRNGVIDAYRERFGETVVSVEEGADNIFGGSLVIATYQVGSEKIEDVVYINRDGTPRTFKTTLELITFIREHSRFLRVEAFFQSKMFHAAVFVALLIAVFAAGWLGDKSFDPKALAVLGSIVGLAAGLFFGPHAR